MEVMPKPLKEQLDIIYRPHPLLPAADCQFRQQEWRQGMTVREILLANNIDPHQLIVIVLDDRLLTVDEWDSICPRPGQIINVKAEVADGGGGGGSNPLQIVAMIALVVVAVAFVQPELLAFGAELGMSSAVAAGFAAGGTAVFMIAGSMVINSIFAAQTPAMSLGSTSGQYSQASPSYSLTGGQNRMRPYESMPVVMGSHRFVPDLASKPYTEYHGEDQYLYQIFHLGLSSLYISDWKIGTNPISNYSDYSWQYQNEYGNINGFPNNVDSTAGAALENSAGWITRTTSPNTYRIGIDIEGTLYYANDSGGMDATSVQIRVQYRPAGAGYWIDPAYILTTGNGFTSGSYQPYYVKLIHHRSIFGRRTWTDTYEISKAEYDAGIANPEYDEDGNIIANTNYELRWRFVAGSGGTVIVSGNSQTTRRSTLLIDVPVGTYDVRVIRETGDSTDARRQDKTSWSTLRSYQVDPAANSGKYAGQNRQGIVIRASEQLNGTISQMSCMASANALYWNGAWRWGGTSNPAHWFMDFAKGRFDSNGNLLYGIGLSDSQIDLAGLAAWANFCAAEGLTFNAVLDRNQSAADMLNGIAKCGFASPTWASGKLGVVWDARNASPVMAFGMGNIIRGSFEVSYITEQLAEEIIVRYINPDKDWTQDEVRVDVPGVTNPQRTSTIDLFGCTNQAMAGKFANYLAAQQYYRKRRIKWDSDFEGFVAGRGDVVLLSHDLTQWGYSGRIVSVTGNVLTLDRTVPRNGATEYFMLKRPDGTMTTYSAVAGSGESSTITLTSTPSFQVDCLPMDHIWFFSPLATPGKKVKILSVTPSSDSRVQVIATDEDPEFYAAWDGSWRAPVQQSLLQNNKPVITGIAIDERLTLIDLGRVGTRVTITVSVKNTFERITVRYKMNGVWQKQDTYTGTIEFDTASYGRIDIQATAINGVFYSGQFNHTGQILGKSAPPANVVNLGFETSGNSANLTFSPPTDLDVMIGGSLSVRYSSSQTGATWNNSTPLLDAAMPANRVQVPLLVGTYLAKWLDSSGNYSKTEALVVNTVDSGLLTMNVVGQLNDGSTWPGTFGGLIYDRSMGGIKLNSLGLIDGQGLIDDWAPLDSLGGLVADGTYTLTSTIDIGRVATSRLTPSIVWNAFVSTDLIDSRGIVDSWVDVDGLGDPLDNRLDSIDSWDDIDGQNLSSVHVTMEISTSVDNATWTAWKRVVIGDYSFRYLKTRIKVDSSLSYMNALVTSAALNVDMPDRVEAGNDLTAPASAYTVTYAAPFQVAPALAVTGQGMQTGDFFTISSKTTSGFTITFKNSAGTAVSRTFDYIAKGY